jgi:hypothetical protein
MADVDEDNPRKIQASSDEIDLSDETVDWRVLGIFSKYAPPRRNRANTDTVSPAHVFVYRASYRKTLADLREFS